MITLVYLYSFSLTHCCLVTDLLILDIDTTQILFGALKLPSTRLGDFSGPEPVRTCTEPYRTEPNRTPGAVQVRWYKALTVRFGFRFARNLTEPNPNRTTASLRKTSKRTIIDTIYYGSAFDWISTVSLPSDDDSKNVIHKRQNRPI